MKTLLSVKVIKLNDNADVCSEQAKKSSRTTSKVFGKRSSTVSKMSYFTMLTLNGFKLQTNFQMLNESNKT